MFSVYLDILQVYENGAMYDPKVLDITEEDLLGSVMGGISNVAAISLQAKYPTLPSVPHSVINGFKNVLAVALATEYSFPEADKVSTPKVVTDFTAISMVMWSGGKKNPDGINVIH